MQGSWTLEDFYHPGDVEKTRHAVRSLSASFGETSGIDPQVTDKENYIENNDGAMIIS